jgi:hypothetical protein
MGGRFDMHGKDVTAGLGEMKEIGIGRSDHQVAVEGDAGAIAQCFDDRQAERDVRYEMTVHDVEVYPIGTGSDDCVDLFAKLGKICRQE